MKRFAICLAALALTSGLAEARCGKPFKGRVRHAAAATVAKPVKVMQAVGGCPGGVCKTPQAAQVVPTAPPVKK